jgi:hypothetical protein
MKISINLKEYYDLKKNSLMLSCLNNAGVDNWEWFGDAYDDYKTSLKQLETELDATPSNT